MNSPGEPQFYEPPPEAARSQSGASPVAPQSPQSPQSKAPENSEKRWQVFRVSGLREEVKAKVAAVAGVPEDVTAFIFSEIDLLPAECRMVKVDAFGQEAVHRHAGGHVTRSSGVTVVGLAL